MGSLVAAPILAHLATAIVCVTLWKFRRAQASVSVAGAVVSLGFSIWLFLTHAAGAEPRISVMTSGGWAAPIGITLVADPLSAIMVLLNAIVGLACVVYSLGNIDERRERMGFHALVHALLAACAGAFVTADLFNLFVWFEIMLMSSFALLTLGGRRAQLEGAVKYVTLNLISSTIFLVAVGLLYGMVGTLSMADIGLKLRAFDKPAQITVVAVLFMVSYGIKAGAFPLFFWLPASYHTPPVAVSAVFSGLLTKVGVYALIRVFTVVFNQDMGFTGTLLIWMAGATMVSGVLGAAAHFDIRRILSFHIVSQIGYMIMGLGVALVAASKAQALPEGDPERAVLMSAATIAMIGSVFYILHHIIVKTNLFLIAGVIERLKGHGQLKKLGGLYKNNPMLGLLFLIPALSLSGIPILSGFWSKLTLIRGGVQAETWGIVAVSLFVSVLTLYSMTKIWAEAFWKNEPRSDEQIEQDRAFEQARVPGRWRVPVMVAPCVALAVLTLAIGFGAGWGYNVSERAAAVILDPLAEGGYVRSILGDEYVDEVTAAIDAQIAARDGVVPGDPVTETATAIAATDTSTTETTPIENRP